MKRQLAASAGEAAMRALPTGTVTFLFTDVEGPTRLLQRLGTRSREVLEAHTRLLRKVMSEAGGVEVGERGDGFFYVFISACDAATAAARVQRLLAEHAWPPAGTVWVRIGMHTGEGVLGGDNYMGLEVHRAARIGAAGHGGQVIVSEVTAALLRDSLPPDLSLKDLGSHRLKDLPQSEELFQLVIPGLTADFPAPRTLGSTAVNLPHQLTSFVGRGRELEEVLESLAASRLLTLTGPGGTGKTRLALRAAAEAAGDFPDGVVFVPLAPITDPELVVPTILAALNLPPVAGDPSVTLREYLESRRILLVLDNFEQILGAGAQVGEWLRAAPGLKVLVTSRAALRIYGEREYVVPPLNMPEPGRPAGLGESEAVAPFGDRASAARPDFSLSEHNASSIVEIVARLDGLPLAVVEVLQGSDAVFVAGWAHHMRGTLRIEQRDLSGAREDLQISMRLWVGDDDLSAMVLGLQRFADLALAEGEIARALRLAGAAAATEDLSETRMLELVQNQIRGLPEASARVGS